MTVQPPSERRPRRTIMTSELRAAKQLYAQNLPMEEIAHRLDRNKDVLYQAMRHLDIPRRKPGQTGIRPDNRRRNAKIIDAVLYGDEFEDILRRWDISPRVMYAVLLEYRRRTRMRDDVWVKFFGETVSKIFTRVKENGTSSQF